MSITHDARHVVPGVRTRRFRWLGWTLVVLAGVAFIIAILPWALSTDTGRGFLLPMINDRIKGRLEASDISLSWLAPVQMRGVRVMDPENREVLAINHLAAGESLLSVLANWEHFRRLDLDSPRVVLYMDSGGGNSLQRAFEPPKPSTSSQGKAVEPVGRVFVRGGALRVIQVDGRTLDVPNIDSEVALDTLSDVRGKLEANVAQEGRIAAEVNLASPAGEQFAFHNASGTVEIRTPQAIDLTAPGAFFSPDANLSGKLKADGHFRLQGGKLGATWKATVAGLAAKGKGRGEIKPVDVEVNGDVHREGGAMVGRVEITGRDVGGGAENRFAHVTGNFRHGGEAAEHVAPLKVRDIIDAVLKGKEIDLPAFALDANGTVDLPRLASAVPALLSIRPDVTVQSGSLRLEKVSVHGGKLAAATGVMTLRDFAADRNGRSLRWEPMEARFDMAMAPGQGLRVREMRITSGFGQLEAAGLARELKGTYNADLAKLTSQLGEVMDLGGLNIAGRAQGGFATNMEGQDRVRVNGRTDIDSLAYGRGERKLDVGKATVEYAGTVDLSDPHAALLELAKVTASAGDLGTLALAGRFNTETGALSASVPELSADLSAVGDAVHKLTGADLPAMQGKLAAQEITANREGNGKPIISGGRANVTGLRIDGNSVGDGKITLMWEEASAQPQERTVQVKRAAVNSSFASFSATSVTVNYRAEPVIEGDASLEADLAKLAPMIEPFMNRSARATTRPAAGKAADKGGAQAPLKMEGKAKWNGSAHSKGKVLRVNGGASIVGFVARRGDEEYREAELRVRHDMRADRSGGTLTFTSLELVSRAMDANLNGKLSDYTGRQELSLAGRYRGDWQHLTRVMHLLAPATAELSLAGPWAGEITVTGPLAAPRVRPSFRGAEGGTALTWDSGTFAGFALGRGRLPVRLGEGRLFVGDATFPLSEGKANLAGNVDFSGDVPTLYMPGRRTVLDRVEINREVGDKLLSRVNPIFGQVASMSGRISMETDDIVLPLGSDLSTGRGRGHIDFSELQLRPRGILGELMSLASMGSNSGTIAKLSGLDFRIERGAIRYENFSVVLGGDFDMIFSGAVAFDDGLDMRVSLPVRAGLMQKAGAGGRAADYAGLLSDVRVEVPLAGTRGQPRLDWSKVDMASLMQRAGQEFVKKQAGKALGGKVPGLPGLLPGLGGSPKEDGPTSRPETRPKSPLPFPLPRPGLGGK